MDIAQQAFLSGMTGGVGGLQGAFEIDIMLAEGKVDEVAGKVESAMRKMFGGELVTREEAAGSQAAAAQMLKQVQMLTTGPFKVAETRRQAYAIIEKMRAGDLTTVDLKLPEGEDAMMKVMKAGDKRREGQLSKLIEINNKIATYRVEAALVAREGARSALGAG